MSRRCVHAEQVDVVEPLAQFIDALGQGNTIDFPGSVLPCFSNDQWVAGVLQRSCAHRIYLRFALGLFFTLASRARLDCEPKHRDVLCTLLTFLFPRDCGATYIKLHKCWC